MFQGTSIAVVTDGLGYPDAAFSTTEKALEWHRLQVDRENRSIKSAAIDVGMPVSTQLALAAGQEPAIHVYVYILEGDIKWIACFRKQATSAPFYVVPWLS